MFERSNDRLALLGSFVSRSLSAIVILPAFGCSYAYAAFSCQGTLTQAQRAGFEQMFSPPYSLSLVSMGSGNMVKRLNTSQLQILKKSPVPVSTNTLSDTHATLLRKFLNENATDGVPGWISTAIGIAAPVAWVGIGADALSQAVNGSGDAGRLQVANLAGTVTQGGKVGVLEQVADDRSGRPKFMASYVYTAQINNSQVTTLLAICSADVVEDGPAPYRVSTSKTDADNCPLISVINTGSKPYRLTIRYTHSGTTIGNSPSSETSTFTHGNFKPGESKDFEINPGANCRRPNRLTIDDVKAE